MAQYNWNDLSASMISYQPNGFVSLACKFQHVCLYVYLSFCFIFFILFCFCLFVWFFAWLIKNAFITNIWRKKIIAKIISYCFSITSTARALILMKQRSLRNIFFVKQPSHGVYFQTFLLIYTWCKQTNKQTNKQKQINNKQTKNPKIKQQKQKKKQQQQQQNCIIFQCWHLDV